MSVAARLFLARHGENRANVDHVLSFRVVDHPLTERGRRQAQALARWLAPVPLEAIFCSPLRRARETAEVVGAARRIVPVVMETLREVNVGSLDGRGDAEAWQVYRDVLARWGRGDLTAAFPGGETYLDVERRVGRTLRTLAQRYPEDDVLVVAHGEILQQVVPRLIGLPDDCEPVLDQAAVVVLEHADGEMRCARWNVIEHLS